MDIKSNLQLLSEAASIDIKQNTAFNYNIESVRESYKSIMELNEPIVTEAQDVCVTCTRDGKYYVEMVNLAPFMLDSKITSINKALDLVAEANYLEPKSVGLIVESQKSVDKLIDDAKNKAKKTKNNKVLENALNKINKNNIIISRLLSEGYDVKKKSKDSEVCPNCGQAKCKCECGDASCGSKKECSTKEQVLEAMMNDLNCTKNEAIFIGNIIAEAGRIVREAERNGIMGEDLLPYIEAKATISATEARKKVNNIINGDNPETMNYKKATHIISIICLAMIPITAIGIGAGIVVSGIGVISISVALSIINMILASIKINKDMKSLESCVDIMDKTLDKMKNKQNSEEYKGLKSIRDKTEGWITAAKGRGNL